MSWTVMIWGGTQQRRLVKGWVRHHSREAGGGAVRGRQQLSSHVDEDGVPRVPSSLPASAVGSWTLPAPLSRPPPRAAPGLGEWEAERAWRAERAQRAWRAGRTGASARGWRARRSRTRTRKRSRTATPWSPVGQTSTPHTQSYQHPLLHGNRKPREGVSDACSRLQVDCNCKTHMAAFVCYVSLCCDVLAHCRSHDSQSRDTVSVLCINVSTCTHLIQCRDLMVS